MRFVALGCAIVLYGTREAAAFYSPPLNVGGRCRCSQQKSGDLENLKVAELKVLYRKLGGKPGSLRKSELIDHIRSTRSVKEPPLEHVTSPMRAATEARATKSYSPSPPERIVREQRPITQQGSRRPRQGGPPQRLRRMPNPWEVSSWNNGKGPMDREEKWLSMASTNANRHDLANHPMLANREERLASMPDSNMMLEFLGTASCVPNMTRGVSCIALKLEGEVWLFDAGEGAQIQVQRSQVRPSKVTKVFITHSHGDHSFGLPGLMCLMGQDKGRDANTPLEIYGPEGLRMYLRVALRYSYSKIAPPYQVHELKGVPFLHGDFVRQPDDYSVFLRADRSYRLPETQWKRFALNVRYGEVSGGRDIHPGLDGVYDLGLEGPLAVKAAPMKHTVPCVGYVVEEESQLGHLRVDAVEPVMQRNAEEIKKELKYRDPRMVYKDLKALLPGESFVFPGDGTTVSFEDIMEPVRRGRKVAILGDTCDASAALELAQGADLVVHEATNTHMLPFDGSRKYRDVEEDAISHGHSTPHMAARFASAVGARQLVLTHFSPRYKGDDAPESVATMLQFENQARRISGMAPHCVIAAWDLMTLPVFTSEAWESYNAQALEEQEALQREIQQIQQMQEAGDKEEALPSDADAVAAAVAASYSFPEMEDDEAEERRAWFGVA
ncbi:unnamed protein product [Chrysoparadoxa australica]